MSLYIRIYMSCVHTHFCTELKKIHKEFYEIYRFITQYTLHRYIYIFLINVTYIFQNYFNI